MSLQRLGWIFAGVGIACLVLALAGWRLGWPEHRVGLFAGAGLPLVAFGLLQRLMPRWWREYCDDEFRSAASVRYRREFIPAMAAYMVVVLASIWLLKRVDGSEWLRGLVAVTPMLPLLWAMRAMVRYLRGIDEMQRRIETEAICIAAMVVPMVYFAAGFLQTAKVIDVDAGAAMIWVFPMTAACYGIAKFFVVRHYR